MTLHGCCLILLSACCGGFCVDAGEEARGSEPPTQFNIYSPVVFQETLSHIENKAAHLFPSLRSTVFISSKSENLIAAFILKNGLKKSKIDQHAPGGYSLSLEFVGTDLKRIKVLLDSLEQAPTDLSYCVKFHLDAITAKEIINAMIDRNDKRDEDYIAIGSAPTIDALVKVLRVLQENDVDCSSPGGSLAYTISVKAGHVNKSVTLLQTRKDLTDLGFSLEVFLETPQRQQGDTDASVRVVPYVPAKEIVKLPDDPDEPKK